MVTYPQGGETERAIEWDPGQNGQTKHSERRLWMQVNRPLVFYYTFRSSTWSIHSRLQRAKNTGLMKLHATSSSLYVPVYWHTVLWGHGNRSMLWFSSVSEPGNCVYGWELSQKSLSEMLSIVSCSIFVMFSQHCLALWTKTQTKGAYHSVRKTPTVMYLQTQQIIAFLCRQETTMASLAMAVSQLAQLQPVFGAAIEQRGCGSGAVCVCL